MATHIAFITSVFFFWDKILPLCDKLKSSVPSTQNCSESMKYFEEKNSEIAVFLIIGSNFQQVTKI